MSERLDRWIASVSARVSEHPGQWAPGQCAPGSVCARVSEHRRQWAPASLSAGSPRWSSTNAWLRERVIARQTTDTSSGLDSGFESSEHVSRRASTVAEHPRHSTSGRPCLERPRPWAPGHRAGARPTPDWESVLAQNNLLCSHSKFCKRQIRAQDGTAIWIIRACVAMSGVAPRAGCASPPRWAHRPRWAKRMNRGARAWTSMNRGGGWTRTNRMGRCAHDPFTENRSSLKANGLGGARNLNWADFFERLVRWFLSALVGDTTCFDTDFRY